MTRNDHLHKMVQMAHNEDKMRGHLRWFSHVLYWPLDARYKPWDEGVKRGRGRPRITRKEVVPKDLQYLGIHADLVKDRTE